MAHILITAPNPAGHRLFYVKVLAEGALARGHSVSVLMRQSSEFERQARLHLGSLQGKVQYLAAADYSPIGLAAMASTTGADLVVDPDGDSVAWSLVRRLRWRSQARLHILIMRPCGQAHRIPGVQTLASLAKLASRILLLRFSNIRVVVLVSSVKRRPRHFEAPDPVSLTSTSSSAAIFKEAHGLNQNIYWFAVVGAIDQRKNVETIARAISTMGPGIGLLLAGKVDANARGQVDSAIALLRSSGTPLVCLDKVLTELEIDDAISAADCVVLAHSNEGSSGIMGKAAAAGTRVIAAGAKSLRRDVRGLHNGGTWVALREESIRIAAQEALVKKAPDPLYLDADAFVEALLCL